MADVVLTWERFETFRQARKGFRERPCIYVLIGEDGELLYLGESGDLWERYKGGTGSMVDAALNGTNKITYVADAPADAREQLQERLQGASTGFSAVPGRSVARRFVRHVTALRSSRRARPPPKRPAST